MHPLLELIVGILLLYFGITLIYLIRRVVGKYGGYEINTLGDAFSLAINPMNWIRLYKVFFYIAEEKRPNRRFYKKLIISNIITGAAILSTQGNIIYSSLPSDILLSSVKELEIRFMSGVMSLPEAFYSLESGEKVFSSIVSEDITAGLNFFVVLLFDSSVPLGMAEMNLIKTINAIKKFVLNEDRN